jgi:catechol 2,3-dioxygenase-like lactoylglutathione lyase family enzyme
MIGIKGAAMNPAPPAVSRILETALYVADLDRAEAFYRRLFSFETMLRDERMCALAVPDSQVLLLFRRGLSARPGQTPFGTVPGHDGHGVLHLAFAIPAGSLQAWGDHLAAAGVAVESRLDWPHGATSLYFRDPDGHSVEIATPGLWPNDH